MENRPLMRSVMWSLLVSLVLCVLYSAQSSGDWWINWALQPQQWDNWRGFLLAPLLHGSVGHLWSNIFAVVVLGSLAGSLYPKATLRALPVIWLVAAVTTWAGGQPGSHHIGISGITYGLMGLLVVMAFLRRDRPAIAGAMIVSFLFASALWGFLPTDGISASGHIGGALGGVVSALMFSSKEPSPPEHQWADAEEEALWQLYQDQLREDEIYRSHQINQFDK